MKGSNMEVIIIWIVSLVIAVLGVWRYISSETQGIQEYSTTVQVLSKRFDTVEKKLSERIDDFQNNIVAQQELLKKYHDEIDLYQLHLSEIRKNQQQVNSKPTKILMKMVPPSRPIEFSIVEKPKPILDPVQVQEVKRGLKRVSK